MGPSLYLASSITENYHDVRHTGGLWYCDCKYFTSGHATCKHIYAVRIMVMAQNYMNISNTTCVDTPQIQCAHCGSTDFHTTTTYKTRMGKTSVYRCDECRQRFTYRPGFKKRWYSDDLITDVLIDAGSGHLPARIVERLKKNNASVSERTIQRWIDDYGSLVKWFASMLRYNVGKKWSPDEKHIKTHPNGSKKKHWVSAVQDDATGLIMAYEVTDNKSGYDASGLLREAIERTETIPDVVIADKLAVYKTRFEN